MRRFILTISLILLAADLMAAAPKVELVKGENRIDVVIAGSFLQVISSAKI